MDNLSDEMLAVSLSEGEEEPQENNNEGGKDKSKNKAEKKLAYKCAKAMALISSQIEKHVTQNPSKWVVVWGLGIAGGNSKQFIFDYFKPRPYEVRLVADKTLCYCFILVENAAVAAKMKAKYNGTQVNEKQILYIGFLQQDPDPEDTSPIESFWARLPAGLTLIGNFVAEDEEKLILDQLGHKKVYDLSAGRILKHRSVRHFGYEFRYGSNDIDYDNPLPDGIPSYIRPVIDNLLDTEVFENGGPEQITVNQYQPGQGIPPHIDTHSCFKGPIVSLSLGSDIVMEFRNKEQLVSIILPARSLLVMNGGSRLRWTHGIASRAFDIVPDLKYGGMTVMHRGERTSLTFRKLSTTRICECRYSDVCDSQNGKITDDNAPDLEAKLVHEVYEKIAPHFDETRHTPWPRVKEFVESIEAGEVLLDVGCGNGKYFHLNNNIVQVGSDMSVGLLDICRGKNAEVLKANALCLPFKDNSFKAVICIAVLHHVSTDERRKAALEEIIRVMKTGGQALIYVWAKDQRFEEQESNWASKQTKGSKNLSFIPTVQQQPAEEHYSFLPIHDNDKDFTRNDMRVPWTNSSDKESPVHHRYYHVFNKGELEELIKSTKSPATITDSYYDQGNWVVRITKEAEEPKLS